jgi:hypothetical protein
MLQKNKWQRKLISLSCTANLWYFSTNHRCQWPPHHLCYGNNFTIYIFHFHTVNGVARDTVKNNTAYDRSLIWCACEKKDTIVHWPFSSHKVSNLRKYENYTPDLGCICWPSFNPLSFRLIDFMVDRYLIILIFLLLLKCIETNSTSPWLDISLCTNPLPYSGYRKALSSNSVSPHNEKLM